MFAYCVQCSLVLAISVWSIVVDLLRRGVCFQLMQNSTTAAPHSSAKEWCAIRILYFSFFFFLGSFSQNRKHLPIFQGFQCAPIHFMVIFSFYFLAFFFSFFVFCFHVLFSYHFVAIDFDGVARFLFSIWVFPHLALLS